jgi:hypothetical protein
MYKTVLQWTLVWIFSKEGKDCKYKILTESDTHDFYNIMFIDLFNCMWVNGTLHFMHTFVINKLLKAKLGVRGPQHQ